MYSVSENFITAMSGEPYQKIGGSIRLLNGETLILGDENMLDDVTIESQCTEDSEVFNFGEIYTGSAELTIISEDINSNEFRGGVLSLKFGIEVGNGITEWIPLGVWDVIEANRISRNLVKIKGYDMTNRLNATLTNREIGWWALSDAMKQIEKAANVKFAQNTDDLQAVFSNITITGLFPYKVELYQTCREEVAAIAKFLGGFAFANREGKIEFRKFGSAGIVLEIPADKRFSAKISESPYVINGVSYTDNYGNVVQYSDTEDLGAVLGFSDNWYCEMYSEENKDEAFSKYTEYFLPQILNNVKYFINEYEEWYSGEIEFYGNPALDIGDVVLTKNTFGSSEISVNFLICGNIWKFRGGQTLISGGISESGAVSSSSGGNTVYQIISVETAKKIKKVDLRNNCGTVSGEDYLAAKCGFSCREKTAVFLSLGMVFLGTQANTGVVRIEIDGEPNDFEPKFTLKENEYLTVGFEISEEVAGGTHQVQIFVSAYAELESAEGYVWGQNIRENLPLMTVNEEVYGASETWETVPLAGTDSEYASPVKIAHFTGFPDTAYRQIEGSFSSGLIAEKLKTDEIPDNTICYVNADSGFMYAHKVFVRGGFGDNSPSVYNNESHVTESNPIYLTMNSNYNTYCSMCSYAVFDMGTSSSTTGKPWGYERDVYPTATTSNYTYVKGNDTAITPITSFNMQDIVWVIFVDCGHQSDNVDWSTLNPQSSFFPSGSSYSVRTFDLASWRNGTTVSDGNGTHDGKYYNYEWYNHIFKVRLVPYFRCVESVVEPSGYTTQRKMSAYRQGQLSTTGTQSISFGTLAESNRVTIDNDEFLSLRCHSHAVNSAYYWKWTPNSETYETGSTASISAGSSPGVLLLGGAYDGWGCRNSYSNNIITIVSGSIMQIEHLSLASSFIAFYKPGTTQEEAENFCKWCFGQAAYLGMFFTDNCTTAQQYPLDNEHMYLGIIDSGGATHGEYSQGVANREQQQWDWTNPHGHFPYF